MTSQAEVMPRLATGVRTHANPKCGCSARVPSRGKDGSVQRGRRPWPQSQRRLKVTPVRGCA